jgi:predicted component of type VI protein secretion system
LSRYTLRCGNVEIPLDERELVIGRDLDCDVHFDDAAMSRRHARLAVTLEGIWLEDLGSPNGVYLNHARIAQRTRLVPGDRFLVGQTTFSLGFTSTRPSTAPPAPARRDSKPAPSQWDTKVLAVDAAGLLLGAGRAELKDALSPAPARFENGLHFVQQLLEAGEEASARTLLGEALDLLVLTRPQRVLGLDTVIKVRAMIARWSALIEDASGRDRLAALARAER